MIQTIDGKNPVKRCHHIKNNNAIIVEHPIVTLHEATGVLGYICKGRSFCVGIGGVIDDSLIVQENG